jgi:hypothetical protein
MAASGRAPRRLYSLEVRGRRHGRLVSLPVVVADYEGERYLVSMLGEDVNWVANVRAAGGHAVLRHGRPEEVRLEEVDPQLRGPILRRYLQLAPGARAHIAVDPSASLDEFEAVAPRYPVFLIRPECGQAPGNRGTTARICTICGGGSDVALRLIRPAPLRRGLGALSLAGYLWARAAYERR